MKRRFETGMSTAVLMVVVSGGIGVNNTVAPTFGADPVIGTQNAGNAGTWTGSPTLTYQIQRNTGSWVDIGGATSLNYTPVDADFGYALRLAVTPNGDTTKTAYSSATNTVQEAPAQAIGDEEILNGGFDSGASWSAGGGWAIGSGVATHTAGSAGALTQSNALTRPVYEISCDQTVVTASGVQGIVSGISIGEGRTETGVVRWLLTRRDANNFLGFYAGDTYAGSIDSATGKPLTENVQLAAPSADMRLTQLYTLPVSPVPGDQLWLLVRVEDADALALPNGDYFLVRLLYLTTWDLTFHKITNHAPGAALITAANIGASNGIRVTADGNDWTLESTANGGTNWTSRGTTTEATWNTSTGVNVLATSGFTLGILAYADPL